MDYADKERIRSYAYEPICYLTLHGILTGNTYNEIRPRDYATRAETAKIIQMIANMK